MDNNLNNNTDNNVNVANVIPGVGDTIQVVPTPINAQSIQPAASTIVTGDNPNNVASTTPQTISATTQSTTTESQPTINTVQQPNIVTETPIVNTVQNVTPTTVQQQNVNNIKTNDDEVAEKAYYKKIYKMMGIIVGSVLLIAGILLYFLLNGSIENRNRLTCTKTIQGEGYQEHIKRYYTFDNGLMMRVYFTHTYTYDNLTDEVYDETYGNLIKDERQPISKYGFGTNVMREDNVVKVTAYDVNYFNENDKDILKKNKDEGYTCE